MDMKFPTKLLSNLYQVFAPKMTQISLDGSLTFEDKEFYINYNRFLFNSKNKDHTEYDLLCFWMI